MPDAPLTPDRLRIAPDPNRPAPRRAEFAELGLMSCFSFLRGASQARELVKTAYALGYDAIGIADANSMAGVVRIHSDAKACKLRPVIGCRIETVEGLVFLAYPQDRAAYGRLCGLISAGRRHDLQGEWQDKGVCEITLEMLAEHSEDVQLILLPPEDLAAEFTIGVESNVVPFRRPGLDPGPLEAWPDQVESDPGVRRDGALTASFIQILPHLAQQFSTLTYLAASYLYRGDDIARIEQLDALAKTNGLKLLATNNVHYHLPERRPLQDVMTAIRHKTTVGKAGYLLHANAERHLKSPGEMMKLFARWPHAIAAAREVADACRFDLKELKYIYPEKTYPEDRTPQQQLEVLFVIARRRSRRGNPGQRGRLRIASLRSQ